MYINIKIYSYRKVSRIQASRERERETCQLTGSTSGSLLPPPQQFPILHRNRKEKAVEDFSFYIYISEIGSHITHGGKP
jgi:hypothetical protein